MPTVPAFVINLERDAPRRDHMRVLLRSVGLSAEFVPAVDGRALTEADRAVYDRKRTLRVYGTDMMDTEIGCYLSHYRLYERMSRENIDTALIMEDDIDISPSMAGLVQELAADTASPWLVVRFESQRGRVLHPSSRRDWGTCAKQLRAGTLYKLDIHVLGFGAYLIRKAGAERMLAYGRRIFMPIDQTMDRFWENGIVPYVVRPFPVHQRRDFESRIGARPSGRHLGHALPFRLLRRWQRISDSINKRLFLLRNA